MGNCCSCGDKPYATPITSRRNDVTLPNVPHHVPRGEGEFSEVVGYGNGDLFGLHIKTRVGRTKAIIRGLVGGYERLDLRNDPDHIVGRFSLSPGEGSGQFIAFVLTCAEIIRTIHMAEDTHSLLRYLPNMGETYKHLLENTIDLGAIHKYLVFGKIAQVSFLLRLKYDKVVDVHYIDMALHVCADYECFLKLREIVVCGNDFNESIAIIYERLLFLERDFNLPRILCNSRHLMGKVSILLPYASCVIPMHKIQFLSYLNNVRSKGPDSNIQLQKILDAINAAGDDVVISFNTQTVDNFPMIVVQVNHQKPQNMHVDGIVIPDEMRKTRIHPNIIWETALPIRDCGLFGANNPLCPN